MHRKRFLLYTLAAGGLLLLIALAVVVGGRGVTWAQGDAQSSPTATSAGGEAAQQPTATASSDQAQATQAPSDEQSEAQEEQAEQETPAPSGEQGQAQGTAIEDPEWPMPNHDLHNTRVAANSEINSGNVDQLGIGWSFAILGRGAYGGAASNPIILNDTVYFQDLASNVYALSFKDGSVLWEHPYDTEVVGPNGPAVEQGKVFAGVGNDTVVALDMATGDELWSTKLEGPTGYSQLQAYNGTLYVGTGTRGYTGGVSGGIWALDTETGEVKWHFQTVEQGFWGAPDINSGAGVWYPPAIDETRGIGHWGTGNPAPFPGTIDWPNGSSRPGPNLYSSSQLAIDLETGALAWYQQPKPHDLFDLDFQAPRIFTKLSINGSDRDVVIGAGKLGRVIAYDAETGEVLWDTEVGEHQNDNIPGIAPGQTVTVFPGILGGVETPMALADGVVYVPIVNMASEHSPTGWDAADGPEAVANSNDHTDLTTGRGQLVALDAKTGEQLWSVDFDSQVFAAATVVNDLVFTATFDGTIHAFTREDGQEVWSWKAPAQINGWPAVSGDTIIWPAGLGQVPQMVALRLGGQGEVITQPPEGMQSGEPGAGGEQQGGDQGGQSQQQGQQGEQQSGSQNDQSQQSGQAQSGQQQGAEQNTVQVQLVEYEIRMPTTIPAGTVTFEVTNNGTIEHSFAIQGQGVDQSFDTSLQPGESQTLQVDLQAGTYTVSSPAGSDVDQGMTLQVTAQEGGAQGSQQQGTATPQAQQGQQQATQTPSGQQQATPAPQGGGQAQQGQQGQLDGDQLVQERCTVCHSRERIDNANKDEQGWTQTVDRMIGYGAQLNDQERQAVIDYLVATH